MLSAFLFFTGSAIYALINGMFILAVICAVMATPFGIISYKVYSRYFSNH